MLRIDKVSDMESSDPSALALLTDRFADARAVSLVEPTAPQSGLEPGDVVLGLGVELDQVPALLTAAAGAVAAGVLLRRPARAATAAGIERQATELGVELGWLPPEVAWNDLHRHLVQRLTPPVLAPDDELGDLAQTIATLTGGLVTIEDTSARVLAYSRSSDEVDELRRLSILGRSGPPEYLALLREWGIYDRLGASEEVVEIAEHPESGVRRRLAVGIFAGTRQLGTIWVQQGADDFGPHAAQALLGAARITAVQLASQRARSDGRPGDTGLAAVLGDGTAPSRLGRVARRPCVVAVFELAGTGPEHGPAADRLRRDELTAIVTVHAAAYRRNALVEQLDGRVYALLPAVDSVSSAIAMLGRAVTAAGLHLDATARGAVGGLADSLAQAARSRREADLALEAADDAAVVSFEATRPRLVAALLEKALADRPELRDRRFDDLVRTDPDGARTVLAYLDTGSDVARVAAALHVHPTTVRYRLRKVADTVGLDLDDADTRLSAHVHLRCGLRAAASGA